MKEVRRRLATRLGCDVKSAKKLINEIVRKIVTDQRKAEARAAAEKFKRATSEYVYGKFSDCKNLQVTNYGTLLCVKLPNEPKLAFNPGGLYEIGTIDDDGSDAEATHPLSTVEHYYRRPVTEVDPLAIWA